MQTVKNILGQPSVSQLPKKFTAFLVLAAAERFLSGIFTPPIQRAVKAHSFRNNQLVLLATSAAAAQQVRLREPELKQSLRLLLANSKSALRVTYRISRVDNIA